MKTAMKYLVWYALSLALERAVLSSVSPLLVGAYSMLSFLIIGFYEGNRFEKYVKKKHPEAYNEYRRRTITGDIWMQKYVRSHMKKSDSCDLELVYNCRRVFLVRYLLFPMVVSLLLAGLL